MVPLILGNPHIPYENVMVSVPFSIVRGQVVEPHAQGAAEALAAPGSNGVPPTQQRLDDMGVS